MDLPVKVGDLVGGKYLIESLLGTGGMGAVFLANHEQLHRRVAIKLLLSDAMSNPDAFARFEREAHAAAALQSDNVTRVIDMGATPAGTPYIVMEYLDGQDLSVKLAAEGSLSIDRAVAYIVEACDALSEAHALNIVHRDLKPANLFLAKRPNGSTRVKVLDFGISKMSISGKPMSLTGTGAVMGSPLYMSPEQLRGSGKVDERTDIWSLGVVLYEFLTGNPPFVAEAFPEQCALILTAPVPPLRDRRPDVPPALEAVVHKCLEKDPAARYATAGELTAALLAVVPAGDLSPSRPQLPRLAATEAMASAPTMAAASSTGSRGSGAGGITPIPLSTTGQSAPAPRRGLGMIVAALAACAAGGLLVAFLMRPHESSTGVGMVPAQPDPVATGPVVGATAPIPPPAVSSAPAAAASTPLPPPPDSAQPAAAAPTTPPPPATHTPTTRPHTHAPPPPAPSSAPAPAAPVKDCSTPYFFDAQGNKVFKPECLAK